MQPELELGHDAEVPAAAAQSPEELRVLLGAGGEKAAVGGHDLRREEALAGDTVHPLEPAAAAAQREPPDARVGHATARHGQTVLLRGRVQLGPYGAALHARGSVVGIHLDGVHRTQVDHDPVVAGAVARSGVGAAAHADGEVVLARARERGGHVLRGRAADHDRRTAIDHAVPDQARLLVGWVLGCDHLATQLRAKLLHGGGCECRLAHLSCPFSVVGHAARLSITERREASTRRYARTSGAPQSPRARRRVRERATPCRRCAARRSSRARRLRPRT